MSNICGKCNVSASNRELLRCFGKCKIAFHPACIDNFKVEQWSKLIKDCPYVKFVCLSCQNDADVNDTSTEISLIKDNLAEVIKTVNMLSCKVALGFDQIQSNISTVIRQPQLINSSTLLDVQHDKFVNKDYAQIVGTGVISDTIQTVAVRNKNYLHVSRLHPSTITDNLKSFVSSKLNLTSSDIDCWPLLPKNRDLNSLNFISFKVGVFKEDVSKTLAPDFWPSGTSIRPFIFNNQQKNARLPILTNPV